MGVRTQGLSDIDAAEAATKALVSFLESIGVPTRLRDLDIKESDIQAIAESDAAQPSFGEGSRDISEVGDLLQFLKEAF
jgi:alcohol dehydrogenase class IV